MKNMLIRLIFEPEPNVNVNHDRMFEFYSENYLSDFNTIWGGTIVMDNFVKKHYRQEPCYQRYVPSQQGTQEILDNILDYLNTNPMAGYYTHVYMSDGGNEQKIR